MSPAKNCFSGTGNEKSTFAITCNRLSLFLKEKGNLRDIGINATFDLKGKTELSSPATETNITTVDLLSKIESPVPTSEKRRKTEESINHDYHLPQYVRLNSFCKPNDSVNKSVSSSEPKTSQMTIFYRGEVLVFDRVSADKARDMMLAATSASSSSHNNQINNRIPTASCSNSAYEACGSRVIGFDLPIARRSSLHKFLSKRKERASERGPYQLLNDRLMVASSLNHEFDLNL